MELEYKGYKIVSDRSYGYYNIQHTGKGSLPKMLSGQYTKTTIAKQDIDVWLSSKDDKEASK